MTYVRAAIYRSWVFATVLGGAWQVLPTPTVVEGQSIPSTTSQADEPAATWPTADVVPIRRLVLYNVGLCQVTHLGSVDGQVKMSLQVPDEKVDDLLKSFVFRDDGGGQLKAIQYRTAPSLAELAAEEFRTPLTLAQLLQSQRGQQITMEKSGGEIHGVIWGVENRMTNGESVETLVAWVGDQLKSYPLADLDGVRFSAAEVQQKMKLSMLGLAQSGLNKKMREIHLLLDGQGPREIGFGYLVDSTLWRITYRLNLAEQQGLLQGWAHIDNSTGQDWEAVDLELRTGRPVVFSADLFAPLLVTRPGRGLAVFDLPPGLAIRSPWVAATLNRALGEPQDMGFGDRSEPTYGIGMNGGMGGMGGSGLGGGLGMGPAGMGGFSGPMQPSPDAARRILQETSPTVVADAQRWTTEVRYRIESPVSLRSGESAALPVMTAEVPYRLFSEIDLSGAANDAPVSVANQMVEITNQTPLPLLGGPVTLQRQGDFWGDIVMDRLDVGAAQSLSYARERSISGWVKQSYDPDRLLAVALQGRSLHHHWNRRLAGQIHLANADSLERTVRVRAQVAEWTTLDDPKVEPAPLKVQTTNGEVTYERVVPGGSSTPVEFVVEGQTSTEVDLDSLTTQQVENYLAVAMVKIEAQDRQRLEQWLELQAQLTAARGAVEQSQAAKNATEKLLAEIRRDIELLRFDQSLVAPLIEQRQQVMTDKLVLEDRHQELSDALESLKQQLLDFYLSLNRP